MNTEHPNPPSRLARSLAPLLTLGPLLGAMCAVMFGLLANDAGSLSRAGRFDVMDLLMAGLKDDGLVSAGEVGRLVTAGLVHVNPTHFAVNALGLALCVALLWRLTPAEHRDARRAGLLLAIAIVASTAGFTVSWLARSGASCGASGAVFGLLGAIPGALIATPPPLPTRLLRLVAIALAALGLTAALALSAKPGIDHAAHLAGWATGLLGGLALGARAGRAALVVGAAFAVTLGLLA